MKQAEVTEEFVDDLIAQLTQRVIEALSDSMQAQLINAFNQGVTATFEGMGGYRNAQEIRASNPYLKKVVSE